MRPILRFVLTLAPCMLMGQGTSKPQDLPRFVQYPDIHGDQVVFTYEGDLWSGSVQGGAARRLTTHPGQEIAAHFSPDGAWIAFTGAFDGTPSVYVMPAQGGSPRRLTWRGNALVRGWSPDGTRVLFSAAPTADCRPITQVWSVDLQGHEPQALPLGKAFQAAISPDGSRILYNPKGQEEYYWKRYRGGQHPEIWLADLKAGTHRRVVSDPGKSAYPMWTAQGAALFLSDRGEGGISNLQSLDLATGEARALTSFRDFDVQWPSTDGRSVVFVKGGFLHVLDLAGGAVKRLDISAPSDDWRWRPRTINPKDFIQSLRLSAGGDRVLLEARGDIFLLPTDAAQAPLNLTGTPGVRERFPELSPDGKRVAYFSDESGEYDLYVRPAEGGPATRIPTGLATTVYHLAWSPDGTKLLFGDKSFALYVMDVASGKLDRIDGSSHLKNDEFTWEVSDYAWAPDSTWVAYSLVEASHNNRIWLYNLRTRQKVALTDGFFDSLNPCFDADGTTLYYLAYNNFDVRLDPGEANAIEDAPVRVMAVKLQADGVVKSASSLGSGPAFRIDVDGLQERTSPLPVRPGNHFHLKAGRGMVGWSTLDGWDESTMEEVFRPGGQAKWMVHFFETGPKRETILAEPVAEWSFGQGGTSLCFRKDQALFAGQAAPVLASRALPARVDLDRLTLTVAPREEWKQIFEDGWRWYRDFFYDKNMHGQDWKAIHDRFAAWLPQLTSREDLNWLMSQMVGELCVSHTYVSGGDTSPVTAPGLPRYAGLLGADLSADGSGLYRFTRVYGPTPYAPDVTSPLAQKVKEGEYLLAVGGHPLKAPDAIYQNLQVVRGQKVKLTVNAKPTLEGARTVEIEPLARDTNLRYERWVADNIREVERLSGGQLGYLHLTAMSGENIGQFDKYWRAFRYRKGIVVDVRGNGGGWTEYFMVSKLENRLVGHNVMQGMAPFRYPGTASDGRFVFLTNEQNGSDGEGFLTHVRARNLGTIVGVPSWGGLVGIINTQRTLDGGAVEQSNNAFYGFEGTWWVENHGVEPDIRVENDAASWMAGHDRQLEVAVETLLKQLADHPTPALPPVPAYPKR